MLKHILVCLVLTVVLVSVPCRAEETDHEIHQELRALLKKAAEAINSSKFEDVLPLLSENPRITPINQEFITTRPAMLAYFTKHFGPGHKLRSVEVTWEADALTELSPDKTWGLSCGKGTEVYTLNDGRVYPMPVRWTSVVVKESDGKWRIRSMHIGTDFLDNPVLNEYERAVKKYAIGGGMGGAIGGLAVGFLLRRRRKS
ncbi:MAG: hypothetical protein ABSG53_04990 [Thermoguttaceae bacterium]|jgi:ketosteroid isomerase-like protein